jgi:transposase
VIWRKVSFGTRSEAGARLVERLLSVRETCRLQRRSLHAFLIEAITAHLQGAPAPALLPPQPSPAAVRD